MQYFSSAKPDPTTLSSIGAAPSCAQPAPIPGAEAARLVETWHDLSPQRRRDLRSALASAAAIVAPDALMMDCAFLNQRLYRRPPAAFGLATRRFANIVSALRAILRRLDRHAPNSIAGADGLSPDWQQLHDALPTRERQLGLIRLMKFCSQHAITPDGVAQDTLDSFESWLITRTLTDDIGGLVRRTASNWRWAASHVAGWPSVSLTKGDARDWYSLPLNAYSPSFAADVEVYLARLGGQPLSLAAIDITDLTAASRHGPARPLRPRSIETQRHFIRIAAAALVAAGRDPQSLTSLSDLVQPIENAVTIMDFHWKRAGGKATSHLSNLADVLRQIGSFHVGLTDTDMALISRLRAAVKPPNQGTMTDKNRKRLQALLQDGNLARLLHFPQELMRRAALPGVSERQAARLAMFAVALELLIICPMRRQNLATLRLDTDLLRPDPQKPVVTGICVDADRVKNGVPIEWPVSADSGRLLQTYLQRHRPVLAEPGNPYLFPGTGQSHKSPHDLAVQLTELVGKDIGLPYNLHIMRHLAVVLYLNAHPGSYEIVRRVLGHKSLHTTITFYAGLESVTAANLFSEALQEQRAATELAGRAAFQRPRTPRRPRV